MLPDHFTVVSAAVLKKKSIEIPIQSDDEVTVVGHLEGVKAQEKCWLEHASKMIEKGNFEDRDIVAWSAYHASLHNLPDCLRPGITQLLPLLYEKAATAAMIKHGMDVIRKATHFLNPGQIPVIALDAPLYALAKLVQWKWPETHGESKYVIMFGGLHLEMNTFGDYLEESGWTTALSLAGIASTGTTDSFLIAAHFTRTRHAHQVSCLALSKLQQDAFLQCELEGPHAKEMWRQEVIIKSPTFQFWNTILRIEILALTFVRAHRERKCSLYVESLMELVPGSSLLIILGKVAANSNS